MKKKILIVAAAFFSSQLIAQEDTTARILDEVITTANKIAQKQRTTGKVITVITKEQIEKSAGRTLAQLLNEQAGLTLPGANNNLGSNPSVYMRGSNIGRTLILVDGIPVYDPTFIHSEFDLNLMSTNSIECVEICRGAQSTLYGSDATAGVINIITTKKDTTKKIEVKATAAGGNYGTFRGNLQLAGRSGKFRYTTRYAKITSKGFSAAHDSVGNGGFDKDGYNSDAAGASLEFLPNPALSIKGFLQYSRYKTDVDASVFKDDRDHVIRSKNLLAGTRFRFQKNNVLLNGSYQYSDIYRHYLNDSGHVPVSAFTKFSSDDYYGKTQFLEAYANIGLGNGFSILQGADYRYSTMNNQYFSISSFGPYAPPEFRDTMHSQASLFASLFYNAINEKLNIELGGRLNVHSRYGNNGTYTFNPSYSIDDHFRIFGSIATGFKAPSLYQLYSPYGSEGLQPERSTNYELGVEQKHRRIQNRLVYFHRIIKDGIDFNNLAFEYYNFTKQTVSGIELESAINPATGLNFRLNYTWLDPKEVAQSRVTFKDTSYTHLLKRPKHHLNLTGSYQIKNGPFISLSAKYLSKRFDFGGYKVQDVLLDSYFLLNAYAEYSFKKNFKVFTDVQNVFNNEFFDVWGYNSIPLVFTAGFTVEFGK